MIISDNIYRPKVSIIIPVYNVKQYLAEALDSVINQTYDNLEIIVVDDGSNDGSEIICEEYAQKDKRIKLIHRENGGLSAARNTGLDNITGEYVAFLDSDDVFLPNAIEKSLNAMLSNNVDCVSFRFVICKNISNTKFHNIQKETIIPSMPKGVYSRKEILEAIANQELDTAAWSKITKREIWNNLRFPEGHVYEELFIILQMIDKIKSIYVEDEVLILYRMRKGSIVSTMSIKNIKDLFHSWSIFMNFVETHAPEIFNTCQIQKIQKFMLLDFIIRYANISYTHSQEKLEVLSLLKEKIKDLGESVKIEDCKVKIRLLYYMIFNHPKLLLIFYPICRITYKAIKKIIQNKKD